MLQVGGRLSWLFRLRSLLATHQGENKGHIVEHHFQTRITHDPLAENIALSDRVNWLLLREKTVMTE